MTMEPLGISSLPDNGVPPGIGNAVVALMLANDPDPPALERKIAEQLGIPIVEARLIVYQIVESFNAAFSHPLPTSSLSTRKVAISAVPIVSRRTCWVTGACRWTSPARRLTSCSAIPRGSRT
jgi:hypothetical protein